MTAAEALAAVERVAAAGGDADDVLRAAVAALHERYAWVAIRFNEEGALVLGPSAGTESGERLAEPIVYNDERIGEVEVGAPALDDEDRATLTRVAELLAIYTLLGWDTGGQAWAP